MTEPDRTGLSNDELVEGLRRQVEAQKNEPFEGGTGAIIRLTGEAHGRTAKTVQGTIDSQGDVEGILRALEEGAAAFVGTKKAKEITIQEREAYEEDLRIIIQNANTLIRAIEVAFAGLQSTKVTPEERYAALETILESRTDAVSSHLKKIGINAVISMLKAAMDKRKNLDQILSEHFPESQGIQGALAAGARRIIKTLMHHLRSAVAGISERALNGFGTVPTQEDEKGFADKQKFLAFIRTKVAVGNGVLVGIGGKSLYCHNSTAENLTEAERMLTDDADPYGGIGAMIYTPDLAQLIEELPPGHELSVQLPNGGTALIKRNKTEPYAIAQVSLAALGTSSENDLKSNVLQYCYQPKEFSESA